MARRRVYPRHWEKHPKVYARTTDTWTTRYYNRKNDPMFSMLGLHTSDDDFHKKEGSSPFLTNIRYMGEREGQQRASAMSRKGARLTGVLGEVAAHKDESEGDAYIDIFEGKAIEWVTDHNDLLTGASFHFMNIGGAGGCVRVTIRDDETKQELADAILPADTIDTHKFSHHVLRFIRGVFETRVLVRLEIIDDVQNDEAREIENRTPRVIRVLAKAGGTHRVAQYTLPNTNSALEEIPYNFSEDYGVPLMGVLTNSWKPMPRGVDVVSGKRKYIVFPVRHDDVVAIYRQDILKGDIQFVTDLVDNRAEFVRFSNKQPFGFLYYVDGYSALRRINLTTWVAEDAIPQPSEITIGGVDPNTLKAKPGASLIHILNSRTYLSGFKDDPNLIQMSLIDDVKPRHDQFNDAFYSPDQSPEASAGSPITALADQSDYLVVFRSDGVSLYDRGGSTTLEDATQVTPEGASLGVLNQEAVCQGKNNIYFYNVKEGVQRFGGSVNRTVSVDIENLLDRIKHKDKVFLVAHNSRIRMYFSFTEETPDSCFYYYPELEGKLPWYMDTNTPVSSAIPSRDGTELYAIHSQMPAVMEVDAQLTDFNSGIWMEWHSQYRVPSTADPAGWTFIRRLHLHEIVDATHSVYIGLDIDHQDRPIVWRRLIEGAVKQEVNPDAIFQHTAEPGTEVISIPMYVRCRNYQVRLKRYCYKDQGEIVGLQAEYGNKDAI